MSRTTKICEELKADISPEYLTEIIKTMEERIDAEDLLNTMAKLDGIQAAMLFAKAYKEVLRWCDDAGVWMHFDGMRWKRQSQAAMTCNYLAMRLARKLLITLADHPDRSTRWYATNLQERAKRIAVINDAKPLLAGKITDLDADAYFLNLKNGVLDLESFELIPHAPEHNQSKLCNASYNPDADCPLFKKFIDEVMQGDNAKANYLQLALGYSLLGHNESRKSFFLYGATNSNGKSTLMATVSHVMGTYAKSIDPKVIAVNSTSAKAADPATASLVGVRMLQLPEPERGMRIDCALFKRLTGGQDELVARNLYEAPITFVPICTPFLNTNYLPIVSDADVFSSDRISVIPFEKHFSEDERDKQLPLKLMTEADGILNWLIEGLRRYYAYGHSLGEPPPSIRNAITNYLHDAIEFDAFWDECITADESSTVTAKALFTAYQDWCKWTDREAEGKRQFMADLVKRNLLKKSGTINGEHFHNVVCGVKIVQR